MALNFTNKEEAALEQFRQNIPDVIAKLDDFNAHDANLIRWIRAREFNLTKAEEMIRKSMKWREENDVDNILSLKLPQYLIDELPFFVIGHDKQGSVICVMPMGRWDLNRILAAGYTESLDQYITQMLERAFDYMKSQSTEKRVLTQFVIIFDFEYFSLGQVLSKQAVTFMMDNLRMFEAQYPETLKAAYAINAPKIFEVLWNLMKPLLTTRTLSKITIYGGNPELWRKVLLENIDSRELPSQYGGSNTTHPFFLAAHYPKWPARARQFNDFETVEVPARKKFIKSFDLVVGNRISWNFKTDDYDIGFQIMIDGHPMYPFAKTDAHMNVQDGLVDAAESGTYSLVFDNSYSRYRPKVLHFAVLVEDKVPDFTDVYFQKLHHPW